ncbi:hypothetical protein NVP1033O_48 [Vibrio phage 1.033.O._10N.222.49.B8]|nr:hypothetical protein NVP1033O_48 [Vibrio phage 1.033.O._10N.222.49.B8]
MTEYTYKYKNIADELKKRDPECTVVVNHSLDSLIYMKEAGNKELNLCNEVLIALGYCKSPEIDATVGLFTNPEPATLGAYHKPWEPNYE